MKVDGPLHNTHSILFSGASTTEMGKEESAQLHATFNIYVKQGYVPPSATSQKKGSRQKRLVILTWPHYVPHGLKAITLTRTQRHRQNGVLAVTPKGGAQVLQ